jgi:hypothetical protein
MSKAAARFSVACVLLATILGPAHAGVAGEGMVVASAVGNLARSRAEPAPECRVSVSDAGRVVLRCRGAEGFARAVFIIDSSEIDVIDIEPALNNACPHGSMTWRYRAATDTLKVVYEATGRFRCGLIGFVLRIDV